MPHGVVLVDDEKDDHILKFDFQSKIDRNLYYDTHCDTMLMHKCYGDDMTGKIKFKCGHKCDNSRGCFGLTKLMEIVKINPKMEEVVFPKLEKLRHPDEFKKDLDKSMAEKAKRDEARKKK